MNVECEVWHEEDGSTAARCTKCGYQTKSAGEGIRSVRRCLVMLKETCPSRSGNFYFCPETEKEIKSLRS